jgi:endonuclease III
MKRDAIPHEIREHLDTAERMAHLLKAINAPVGPLGVKTLEMSTTALASNDTNDTTYNKIENELLDITKRRNAIASQMLSMLEDSTFDGKGFNEAKAQGLINAAEGLLVEAIGTEEARE